MKPVCRRLQLVCGALDGLDIGQVAFDELDSAFILSQRDAFPTAPFVFRGHESALVPGEDEELVYAMQEELCADLCMSSFTLLARRLTSK